MNLSERVLKLANQLNEEDLPKALEDNIKKMETQTNYSVSWNMGGVSYSDNTGEWEVGITSRKSEKEVDADIKSLNLKGYNGLYNFGRATYSLRFKL